MTQFSPGLAAAALAGLSCLLWPVAARAATCVVVDQQRDGLTPEQRASFRASTIRLLLQLEATAPLYRLSRTYIDDIASVQSTDHAYAPNLLLSLGLGWGSHDDDD